MRTMLHDAFEATVAFDEIASLFHGEVSNLRDVVTFQSVSIEGLQDAFADSIEDYQVWIAGERALPGAS